MPRIGNAGTGAPLPTGGTVSTEGTTETAASGGAAEAKSSSAAAQPSPGAQKTVGPNKDAVDEHKLAGSLQQSHLKSLLDSKTPVKRGMQGSEVGKLQDFLISKGYMTKEQKATGPGTFGPKTERQTHVKDKKQADGSYKASFTDVTGDGRSDIAIIKPGTYEFHTGHSKKFGDHLRPDSNISAWRDTNQDGKITGKEKDQSYKATGVLFHKGGTKVPISVGCQTMAPSDLSRG